MTKTRNTLLGTSNNYAAGNYTLGTISTLVFILDLIALLQGGIQEPTLSGLSQCGFLLEGSSGSETKREGRVACDCLKALKAKGCCKWGVIGRACHTPSCQSNHTKRLYGPETRKVRFTSTCCCAKGSLKIQVWVNCNKLLIQPPAPSTRLRWTYSGGFVRLTSVLFLRTVTRINEHKRTQISASRRHEPRPVRHASGSLAHSGRALEATGRPQCSCRCRA